MCGVIVVFGLQHLYTSTCELLCHSLAAVLANEMYWGLHLIVTLRAKKSQNVLLWYTSVTTYFIHECTESID